MLSWIIIIVIIFIGIGIVKCFYSGENQTVTKNNYNTVQEVMNIISNAVGGDPQYVLKEYRTGGKKYINGKVERLARELLEDRNEIFHYNAKCRDSVNVFFTFSNAVSFLKHIGKLDFAHTVQQKKYIWLNSLPEQSKAKLKHQGIKF